MIDFLRSLWSSLTRTLGNCRGTDIVEIADTTTSNLDYAIPEHWDTKIRIDGIKKAFWGKRFEGKEGSQMPIIVNTDFTKMAGDYIHIQTMTPLMGAGVTGETVLQGAEEALSLGQFDLTVDWIRHAVGFNKRGTKRANFNAVATAGTLLSEWLARHIDDALFEEMVSTESPDTIYSGGKSAENDLDSSSVFNTATIDLAKLALERKGARPFKVKMQDGEELHYYGMVIDPVDAYNLRGDEAWYAAQRDANDRGLLNPIFTGAMGIYNGVIIYTYGNVAGYNGTWLRPEATLSAAIAGTGAATVTVTINSTTALDATKFFTDTTGYIQIDDEIMAYTASDTYYFTVTGPNRGALNTTAAAHAIGARVTQRNVSKQVAFGAESACRAWGLYPRTTKQVTDYEFMFGVGIEAVFGSQTIKNKAGKMPNYLLIKSYADNPGTV